jgi:hypothetical protein
MSELSDYKRMVEKPRIESLEAMIRNLRAELDRTKGNARCALKDLTKAYVNLLEVGRDRIVSLGGDCDSVEKMETGDPVLAQARAVIQSLT